uniref:Uncharacterized protein n=1 Tax=viral metagenome TaxID=1070528 RepID=A0A6M3IRT9_9ZZZZ
MSPKSKLDAALDEILEHTKHRGGLLITIALARSITLRAKKLQSLANAIGEAQSARPGMRQAIEEFGVRMAGAMEGIRPDHDPVDSGSQVDGDQPE